MRKTTTRCDICLEVIDPDMAVDTDANRDLCRNCMGQLVEWAEGQMLMKVNCNHCNGTGRLADQAGERAGHCPKCPKCIPPWENS